MAGRTILITLALFMAVHYTSARLDADNVISSAKIVAKSCYVPGVRTEATAKKFMDCYDEAPGKEHFVKCQKEVFNGRLFDSVANFRANCGGRGTISRYSSCLETEFENAGEDMNDAVRQLNACQLPLFKCGLTGK